MNKQGSLSAKPVWFAINRVSVVLLGSPPQAPRDSVLLLPISHRQSWRLTQVTWMGRRRHRNKARSHATHGRRSRPRSPGECNLDYRNGVQKPSACQQVGYPRGRRDSLQALETRGRTTHNPKLNTDWNGRGPRLMNRRPSIGPTAVHSARQLQWKP